MEAALEIVQVCFVCTCACRASGTLGSPYVQGKYLRNAGVQALSYGEAGSPIAGGESTAELLRELQASTRKHSEAGLVSIQVQSSEAMCAFTAWNLLCML
jgi:hypothetical protein